MNLFGFHRIPNEEISLAEPRRYWIPRPLEWLAAGLGLLFLLPLFAFVAALIKLDTRGPLLFCQERVGKDGQLFQILKFRSMVVRAEDLGGRLTVGESDPRVTRVGMLLRKCKLDELPQLYNVMQGNMSLVGPRPELPEYVRLYDEIQRAVLLVPPGITDPASLAFRDESDLLAESDDPERVYVEQILPRKLELNLEYLERRNGWSDVGLIAQTLRRAVLRV